MRPIHQLSDTELFGGGFNLLLGFSVNETIKKGWDLDMILMFQPITRVLSQWDVMLPETPLLVTLSFQPITRVLSQWDTRRVRVIFVGWICFNLLLGFSVNETPTDHGTYIYDLQFQPITRVLSQWDENKNSLICLPTGSFNLLLGFSVNETTKSKWGKSNIFPKVSTYY